MDKKSIPEVGDFIQYKKYHLAVIAEKEDILWALCDENHLVAKIDKSEEIKIIMKKGCKSIVAAIYDDMKMCNWNK